MAVEEWFLQEEGCLQFNGRPTSISYSPTSHCFIATLEDGSIEVLDVSSGRTLKRTFLEGSSSSDFGSLQCRFCPGVEKLFVTDRRTVGLRKDLNGVLLLDSILQAPVAEDCDAPITLELTLADVLHHHMTATMLDGGNDTIKVKQLQVGIETCLTTAVPPVLDVMETLKEQIKDEINKYHALLSSSNTSESSSSAASTGSSNDESDKAAKWVTCKLRLPAGALLCAFDGMVTSLHKNNRTSSALPIASAMLARVMALTGTSVLEKKGQPVYKQLMFVEAARRQTFSTWPHTDYKWAYPEAMAQAGFYHQPTCTGDDRAMCFTCSVCLVCWEPTDEPWSEHERHSAECPFVRGDRTENVPMSVSLATTPAKHHGNTKTSKITSISSSSCPCLMATSSDTGHIVVWDMSDQLKVYSQFMVDSELSSEEGKDQISNEAPPPVQEAWPETTGSLEQEEQNVEVDETKQSDGEEDIAAVIQEDVQSKPAEETKAEIEEETKEETEEGTKQSGQSDETSAQETTEVTSKDDGVTKETEVAELLKETDAEDVKHDGTVIQELHEEDVHVDAIKLSHTEEAEECSEGIVEEPHVSESKDEEKAHSEDATSTNNSPPKLPSMHVTASAIVCPPDQDHQHLKKLYTPEHKPVLIAGISPCHNNPHRNSKTEEDTDNRPYLLLYDASAEKVPSTTLKGKDVQFKPEPKLSSSQPTGSQEDLYSVLSSDEDLEHEYLPMMPSSTIQSSLMKKCAAAISGTSEPQEEEVLNLKHRNVIQKIELPKKALQMDSSISQIIPCLDGHHILVVVHLKELKSAGEISSQGENNMYFDHETTRTSCPVCLEEKLNENVSFCLRNKESEGCLLLLYKLLLNENKAPTLSEPLHWKKLPSSNSLFNVIGLPVDSSENLNFSKELLSDEGDIICSSEDDSVCNSRFAGVTQDGSVLIIDASSLDTLARYCLGKDKQLDNAFNDIVYCPGIDCLCCSTFQGYLYFLSLVHNTESIDSGAAGDGLLSGADSLIESISLSEDQTVQNLLKLLQKTEFENLVPRFTAIVPPAWTEMQQEQQQRQHPQHLHQQSLGDATLHTRTWKLLPEAKNNSSGEQIFELLLSKQCHVGHVDIKFSLNSSSENSSMKVYLLKPWSLKSWQQESTSSGSKKKVPILSAAKENGHILCGPVELEKGPHMRIALTCPDLVKTRHRILLLVFESTPQVNLEEISVTVRRFKYSPKPSSFMQYTVMLEEPAFHQQLLDIVCSAGQGKVMSEKLRKLALDMLCWIAGICVHTPIRRNSLVHQVQRRLTDLIPVCFLQSGRTIARQCSVLLLLCARQADWDVKYGSSTAQKPIKNPPSTDVTQGQTGLDRKAEYSKLEMPFRTSLLLGILQVLPNTVHASSAGGLHHLFSLLVGYAALEDIKKTTNVCQELLTEVSTKMDSLMLHSHTALQARYGLYGLPFEPVLFDLSIPPIAEMSIPWTVPSAPTSSQDTSYSLTQPSYWPGTPKQVTSAANTKVTSGSSKTGVGLQDLESKSDSSQYITSLVAHQGLLEVEPLHFNCTSSSDGARVERSESTPVVSVPGLSTTGTTNGQSYVSMLPSVSVSTEPDVEFLKQHYTQLAKLHLHKQELEKHKQELEELAMWSSFPKVIPNPVMEGTDPGGNHYYQWPEGSYYYPQYSSGGSVNLSLQKKMANKKVATTKKGSHLPLVHGQQSQLPLPQSLIIERLHSGARHHVILDFGSVVEITDIIIPSCSDLSSLSIDAWLEGEEKDAKRVAIVSDIGSCGCVLKDLHPPPVCQFVKLTVVGRPRSNAKVKMKIGEFYGRPHTSTPIEALEETFDHRLRVLENMYEEVHCHYSLACSKLETLLDNSNDKTKIQSVYNKCIDLQLQLNFVHQSIKRVQIQQVQTYGSHIEAGYDQMRVLCTCLAETLVALAAVSPDDKGFLAKASNPTELQVKTSSLPRDLCEVLFKNIFIHGNPVLRVRVAALLLHTSCTKPWWGSFLADVLKQFFSASQQTVFPQERVFVVLSLLVQQSPDVMPVLKSLLRLLDEVLSGQSKLGQVDTQNIDISLVGWIVLLLAHILNTCGVGRIQSSDSIGGISSSGASSSSTKPSLSNFSDKWDFIVPSPATQTSQQSASSMARQNRHKLRRQISIHEKQLQELQKQQKKMMEGQGTDSSEVQHIQQAYAKSKFTSQALKHIKDLVKLRTQEAEASSSKGKKTSSGKIKASSKTPPQTTVRLFLSQISTIPVMKKMIQLVLNMDSSCPADLVLTICKVVALLSSISQPSVYVTDILSSAQVESIFRLCSSNRGESWTRHALITLLQDLIHGYKSEVQITSDEETKQEVELRFNVNRSEPKPQQQQPQPGTFAMPSMENLQSAMDYPMDWTNVPPSAIIYDIPPPHSHLPTSVTSSLYIQPKPQTSTQTTSSTSSVTKLSTALDARLELGVTMEAEWDLKTLQLIQGDAVLKGMTNSHLPRYRSTKVMNLQTITSSVGLVKMFFNCFEKLFSKCNDPKLDLASLLELWLRLNAFLPSGPNKTQLFIPLGKKSLANLLSFLATCPSISLQTFYLSFEVMRTVLEKSTKDGSQNTLEGVRKYSLPEVFVSNPELLGVLQRTLIEGSPKDYGAETGVGTSGTGIKQVEAFLSSLAVALEKQEDGVLLAKFHNMMLELLCSLASGNVNYSGKPIQMKPILRVLLKHSPSSTKDLDVSLVIRLLNLTMRLSLQHLQKKDEISLQASSHFHETPRLTTSSNLMEGKPTDGPWIVHSTWLTKLLGVIIMFVQLPEEKTSKTSENGKDSAEKLDDGDSKKEKEGKEEEGGASKEDKEDMSSVGDAIDEDASDSMVKTLQAMAKAVEKNASQSSEEAQPIINVIEEESSSSSTSGTDTSGGEEDSTPSADGGPIPGINEKEDEVVSDVKEGAKKGIEGEKEPKPSQEKDAPPVAKAPKSVLPDIIITDDDICLNLLQCLNLCSSNNIGVLLTGANILNSSQGLSVSGDPVSVEDGILQVVSVIYSQLTHQDFLVAMVIKYLSGCEGTSVPVTSLSEPFLWFLLRMLDSNKQVEIFNTQGGYELLFKNLVSSYSNQLNDNTHDLIPVMRQLTKLAHKSSNGTAQLLLNAVWEAEKDHGLVNYAPFGTISCSRPSSHPADTLLKASIPHRRTRSAAWSYHFYPGELWCDLTVNLPTPILLHAVHLHPHTAGLTSCPSYVALDYSVDGAVMTPASKPVMTSGLSVIRLHFDQPQIAQRICVRCRRPRDSESLGLSQIKVWGTSLYGPPTERSNSSSQGTYSDCLNWVCLLHHCLHRTPSAEISSLSSSSYLSDVFSICISLLGAPQSDLFTGCQEAVLQRLAVEFSELGQVVLKKLLVTPVRAQISQSTLVSPSAVQLVFKLGKTGGDSAKQRLRILADWLESLSSYSHVSPAAPNNLTGLVQAAAAVLWTTAGSELASIVQEEYREQLFRSLFEWSQLVARQEPLKQAIDYVIGSLCHVCPSYFQLLLHLTDAQELVDQARTQNEFEPSYLVFVINRSSMETLGRACQSPITSHLLLASGLLNVLHDSITRLCNNLLASRGSSERSETNNGIVLSLDYLSDVLSFMSVCTEEPVVKTWCGESGRDFWKPLMLLLGSGILFSPMSRIKRETPPLGTRHRIALESATIKYFSQCISCHPDNQNLFSRLLCEVMETPFEFISTTGECMPGSTRGVGLDGFLRRLVLEALLQDEKVKVCIQYGSVLKPFMASQDKNFSHSSDWHPRFGAGYNILLIRANLSSTIEELDEIIHPNSSAKKGTEGNGSDDDKAATYGDYDDLAALGDADILEGLSIAAGINVKSKRAKSSAVLRKISSQKLDASLLRQGTASAVCRHNALLGNILIQNKTSLTSLLSVLMSHGLAAGTNCIELSLKTCGNPSSHVTEDIILNTLPLPTALHKFASFNGLAILSSRLSCSVVMNQPAQETASSDSELALPLAFPLPLFSLSPSVLSRIPGHSLAAFGLFISLPGYADVLLRDRPKAQCLLRLLLGAEDDGNGGHVLSSQIAGSLPTLPFQILRLLFHSTLLSNDAGVSLRQVALEQGAVQLVLMCLGVLSHHEPRVVSPTDRLALQAVAALTGNLLRGSDQGSNSEKQYWAKGTGFGTGSTASDWDIENAMKKQQAEEAHTTCMLQVLGAYIHPSGVQNLDELSKPDYTSDYSSSSHCDKIPTAMAELLSRSCLVPTLSSYLRNDSVLDMARHVPLYQSVLEVMRALATCPSLVNLLAPADASGSSDSTSLAALIDKMKQCVDTYSKTLRTTSQAIRRTKRDSKQKATSTTTTNQDDQEEQDQDSKEADAEGLALLIPDIQATANLVQDVLSHLHDAAADDKQDGDDKTGGIGAQLLSNEEKYLAVMKPLQFDMYEIVSEEDQDRLEFTLSYHFASTLRSATSNGEMGTPARARRLAQEITSLSTSLPLSSSSSVFVRCDETRLDIMKVLITGPAETPYANGCFEFDVYFPQNYPNAPMQINFETTGHHTIRFNPNLYNDGKVCLSILNTWHGRPEEKWNPQTSSFLQVLVSTQSLILVAEPYFNEPGYERSRGTPAGKQNSQEYNANIRQASVKWAMLEPLRKPTKCFKEVIESHFYLKKDEILEQCETWITEIEALTQRNTGGRAAVHHLHSLRQHTAQLRQELKKLSPPKGLQDK